jgi:uncharacterized protein (DUF849 family)
MASHKVIISCKVAGSIHAPSMLPPLPVMPAEIAESALGAAVAGINAQQVMQVSNMIEALGLEIATPAEACEVSRRKVAFGPQHTVR